MAAHLNPILSSVDKAKAAVTANVAATNAGIAQIEKFTATAEAASANIVSLTQDVGAAQSIINFTQEAAIVAAQDMILENLNLGGGTKFLGQRQAKLQQDIIALDKAEVVEDKARAADTTGVLSFFSNMISLDNAVARTDDARQDIADTKAGIAALTSSQESISRVINTAAQTKSKATVSAVLAKTESVASIEANKAMLNQAAVGANNAKASMAATDSQLTANLRAIELDITLENQEARREGFRQQEIAAEQRAKEFEVRMPLIETQLKTAQENLRVAQATNPSRIPATIAANEDALDKSTRMKLEAATTAADIQLAAASLNMAVPDATFITSRRRDVSRTANERAKFNTLEAIGARPNLALGATPSGALRAVAILEAENSTAPAVVALMKLNREFQRSSSFPKGGFKKQGEYDAAFDKYVADTNAVWESNISDGDTNNPYHAPPMAVLSENYEAVKATKFYNDILEPMAMKEFSMERILTAGLIAQNAGSITIEEIAAGTQTIINAAMAYNRDTRLMDRIGGKAQTTYNMRPGDYTGLSFATPIAGASAGLLAAASKTKGKKALALGIGAAVVGGVALLTGDGTDDSPKDMSKIVNITAELVRMKSAGIGTGE